MQPLPRIRVLIADRNEDSRHEMCRILGQCDDVEVVGTVASGPALRPFLEVEQTDVVVVDLDLREPNAFQAARALADNGGGPCVLVLAQRNDSRYVARAIHAGSRGYLLKHRAFEELADAVRRVAAGGIFVSSGVAGIETEERDA